MKKIKLIGFYDYTVILTYLSLLSAVFGMIQAVDGKFGIAVLCLFVSGLCDGFDGTVARSKENRTEDEKAFGIQLDSLCDVISFGVFPAFLCYFMGADSLIGITLVFLYCMCAVIRLAFFNVLEGNRQKEEEGCALFYRGLPVTSISLLLPVVYGSSFLLSAAAFEIVIHIVLFVVAFLFVLDFKVPKLDWKKVFVRK